MKNKKKDELIFPEPQIVENVHEAAVRARIRAQLDLPMNKRTNFLRVRLPSGGSAV